MRAPNAATATGSRLDGTLLGVSSRSTQASTSHEPQLATMLVLNAGGASGPCLRMVYHTWLALSTPLLGSVRMASLHQPSSSVDPLSRRAVRSE